MICYLIRNYNVLLHEAIQCPAPLIPVNGHLVQSELPGMDGGRHAVGSLVRFNCEGSYYLEGEDSIICTETGAWSNPPPLCKYLFERE